MCLHGECLCQPGFSGAACEHGCLHGCSRRGNCTGAGTCECGGGWGGPDCAVPPMALRGCAGTCAAVCAKHCDEGTGRYGGAPRYPADASTTRLVESAAQHPHHHPDDARSFLVGFLWRRAPAEDVWECSRACSAACVARCEEERVAGGEVE